MRAPGPRRRERGTTRTRAARASSALGMAPANEASDPRRAPRLREERAGARRRTKSAAEAEAYLGGGTSRASRAQTHSVASFGFPGEASPPTASATANGRDAYRERSALEVSPEVSGRRARDTPAREFRAHPRARRPSFALGPLAVSARARQELPVRQAPERARGSRPRVPRDGVDEDPGDVQGRAPRRVPGGVEFGPERGQRGGEARARDETRRRNAPPRLERRVESGERRGAEPDRPDPGDR